MRLLPCALLLVASTAAADKKLQQMTPGFEREARSCAIQVSGLEKVQVGSGTLAPTLTADDKSVLDKDLEILAAGLLSVKAYCTAVTELAAFLQANAAAAYRSVENELDARDNKVRKLRKDSKKTLEVLQPITRRWIGRVAQAQVQQPAVSEKRTPTKFPGGRSVELPSLPGTFKLSGTATGDSIEYADKSWSATVFVRSFKAATCDQQQRLLPPTAKTGEGAKLPGTAEGLDTAWYVVFREGAAHVEGICVNGKTGGWLGTLTVRPTWTDAATPLRSLMIRIVSTQAAQKTP